MPYQGFQFSLRALFLVTTFVAIVCALVPVTMIAIPYVLKGPHQREVEKSYGKKKAEIDRLRRIQHSLPSRDPDLDREIKGLQFDLGFEEAPDTVFGFPSRQWNNRDFTLMAALALAGGFLALGYYRRRIRSKRLYRPILADSPARQTAILIDIGAIDYVSRPSRRISDLVKV